MDIRSLANTASASPAHIDNTRGSQQAPAVSVKPVAEPTQQVAAVQQPSAAPSTAQVTEAIKSINKAMQAMSQNVEFVLDEDTDQAIVKVVVQETKEVIRQIPSKEALEIAKALDKASGLLIKQQA